MDRSQLKEDEKRRKFNRMISYVIIVVSIIILVFCIYQAAEYISLVNKRSTLTKNLESLKQDSNYLRDNFDVLKREDYYSVYIDSNFQYVDSNEDFVSVIR
jgi:cell division protein FtsB